MRRLATAAFSFSAAVLSAQYLPFGPWVVRCGVLAAALSFIGFLFKANVRLRIFLILPAIAAGFLWTAAHRQLFFAPALALDGATASVNAVVAGNPIPTDYGSKTVVRVLPDGGRPVKALFYTYGEVLQARPGGTVRFTARFRLADTMYGEETRSYYADGVYLLGQNKGDITVTGASPSPAYLPARLAGEAFAMIDRIFTPDISGFMRALLLGDTTRLGGDTALAPALKTAGIWHIVSVSGMNIAFLVGLLGAFVKKKRMLSAVAIPVIFFFMAVVGFTPSVTRAGVMQFFVLLAPLLRRESDAVTSLSASLLGILLVNPFAAAGAGLQLSFAATLGILLLTGRIYGAADSRLSGSILYRVKPLRKAARVVIAGAATTLGALVFTVPVTALHFGTVSLIAPLANILILWAVTLAFYAGAAAVALGFVFVPAGTAAAYIAVLPVRYICLVADRLSKIPFASVYTQNAAVVIWLVFVYLALVAAAVLRVRPRRLLMPAGLSVILLCLVLLLTSVFGYKGTLTVTALDVGQGQCVVVEDGAFTAVVDCGSLGKDAFNILAGYLQSSGHLRIDLLILTHYHEDHAGGVPGILGHIPVAAVALPDPAIDDGPLKDEILSLAGSINTDVIVVDDNLSVTAGAAVIRLYEPLGSADENERGLSVLCTEGAFDALITGDMSAAIERRLIAAADLPDIELLVVGHHGSRHSTSDELLTALRPEIAVISVGYNTYGHPSEETLRKLAAKGIATYRTDRNGSVAVKAS